MIAYPLRVLFIEDDIKQSESLSKLLRNKIAPANLETFFCTNLEEGISESHALIPCVVFLDLVFPGTKHWSETVAKIPQIKGVVIVVTEMNGVDVEMACRANGALDVLTKSKIHGLIEILIRVITNIRLNALARQADAEQTVNGRS